MTYDEERKLVDQVAVTIGKRFSEISGTHVISSQFIAHARCVIEALDSLGFEIVKREEFKDIKRIASEHNALYREVMEMSCAAVGISDLIERSGQLVVMSPAYERHRKSRCFL